MGLLSGEGSLLGLQMVAFLLCPHMWTCEEREEATSLGSLLILMTSSKRNYFPKAPSPNTVPLGIRASTNFKFMGTQFRLWRGVGSCTALSAQHRASSVKGLSKSKALTIPGRVFILLELLTVYNVFSPSTFSTWSLLAAP